MHDPRCCAHQRHHHGHHFHEDEQEGAPKQADQVMPQLPVLPLKSDASPADPLGAEQAAEAATLKAELIQQEVANGAKRPVLSSGSARILRGSKRAPFSQNDQRPQVDTAGAGQGGLPVTDPGPPSLETPLPPGETSAAVNEKKPDLKQGNKVELPASSRPLADGKAALELASKRNTVQAKDAAKLAAVVTGKPDPAKSTEGNLPIVNEVDPAKLGAVVATQRKAPDMRAPEVKAPQRAFQPQIPSAKVPATSLKKDDGGTKNRTLAAASKRAISIPHRATNEPEVAPNLPKKRLVPLPLKEAGLAPKPPKPRAPFADKTKEEELKRGRVVPQGPKSQSAACHAKSLHAGKGLGVPSFQDPLHFPAAFGAQEEAVSAAVPRKLQNTVALKHDGGIVAQQSAGKSDAEAAVSLAPRSNVRIEIKKEPRKIRGPEEAAKAEQPSVAVNKAPAVVASGIPLKKLAKDARLKTAKATDNAKRPTSEIKSKTAKVIRKDHDDQDSNGDASPAPLVKKLPVTDATRSRKAEVKHHEPTAPRTKVQTQAKGKPVARKSHGREGKNNKETKQKHYNKSASELKEASEMATYEETPVVTEGNSSVRKAHAAPPRKKPRAVPKKSSCAPPVQHGARKEAARKRSIQSVNETEATDFSAADESPKNVHLKKTAPQNASKVHKENLSSVLFPEIGPRQKRPMVKEASEVVVKETRAGPAIDKAARQLQRNTKTKAVAAKKKKPAYSRDYSSSYDQSATPKEAPKQNHPGRYIAPTLPMLGRLGQIFYGSHKAPHKRRQAEPPATPSEINTVNDFSGTETQVGSMFSPTTVPTSRKKHAKRTLASDTDTGAVGTSVAGTTAAPTSRAGSAIDTTAITTAATTVVGTTRGGSSDESSDSDSPSDPLKMMRTRNLPRPRLEDDSTKRRMFGALMAVAGLTTALTVACFAIAMIARQALEDWDEMVGANDGYDNVTSAEVKPY